MNHLYLSSLRLVGKVAICCIYCYEDLPWPTDKTNNRIAVLAVFFAKDSIKHLSPFFIFCSSFTSFCFPVLQFCGQIQYIYCIVYIVVCWRFCCWNVHRYFITIGHSFLEQKCFTYCFGGHSRGTNSCMFWMKPISSKMQLIFKQVQHILYLMCFAHQYTV